MKTSTLPSKVLIIAPAWVGDLVMSQVLLKLIKQVNSDVIIDVLVPSWLSSVLNRMPEVQNVYELPMAHGQFGLLKRWRLGRSLAKKGYQQAIVLPNSWKSAVIPFAAKIPKRTGWRGEFRWGLLNDVYYNKKLFPLMIQQFAVLGLASRNELPNTLPFPEFKVSSSEVDKTLAKFNLTVNKPVIALCPGAEFGSAKRWPAVHYAEVAKQMVQQGWSVWLFGSNKDKTISLEIQNQSGGVCTDLIGLTNLSEAIDLLAAVKVVVTNDSGLMHVAAALKRPIIAIYGSSSPRFTPPLTEEVKILNLNLSCSPCFQRECPLGHLKCLQDLSPEKVIQAISILL